MGATSVTLINIFEVPAGDENEFIIAWKKTRDYLMTLPAHIETAVHQSLNDARFRFVNIAQWASEEEFNAAIGSQGVPGSGIRAALADVSRALSGGPHWLSDQSPAPQTWQRSSSCSVSERHRNARG